MKRRTIPVHRGWDRRGAQGRALAGAVFWALALGVLPPAQASLKVSPSLVEVAGERGTHYTGTYRVENLGQETYFVKVEPEDWLVRLLGRAGSLDVSDWLEVDPESFSVKPGEVQNVDFLIKVPPKLDEERVAQVFFLFGTEPIEKQKEREKETSKSPRFLIGTRIGVIVYLAPKGAEVVKPKVRSIKVSRNVAAPGTLQLFFDIAVENHGNVHIRPDGKVIIRKGRAVVAEAKIDHGLGVFAGTVARFYARTAGPVALPDGRYKARAELTTQTYEIEKAFGANLSFDVKGGDLVRKGQQPAPSPPGEAAAGGQAQPPAGTEEATQDG